MNQSAQGTTAITQNGRRRTVSESVGFRQCTEFLGRNGHAMMSGIHMDRLDDDLMLMPITSRRTIGRAYMLIPMGQVPEVAKAMLRVCGALQHIVVEVRGGVAEVTAAPPGISVKIIDHDNLEAEAKQNSRKVA